MHARTGQVSGRRIVRSLCGFARGVDPALPDRLDRVAERLAGAGWEVQTCRACARDAGVEDVAPWRERGLLVGLGSHTLAELDAAFDAFVAADGVALNLACVALPGEAEVAQLLRIIRVRAAKCFDFAFTFNNAAGSPFFPAATWAGDGYAVGLQPTDLAAGCATPEAWCTQLDAAWAELLALLGEDPDFLGIDASTAPLFADAGSLVGHVRRWSGSLDRAATSDLFLRLTAHLKRANPRPVGLNGLMLPCLEDFLLAEEYAAGRFGIERNVFLALHCGLGIDTYPIGVDESPARVLDILRLLHGLATRYAKPLSVRFVSDGRARIGERTDFGNPYLRDVVVRAL